MFAGHSLLWGRFRPLTREKQGLSLLRAIQSGVNESASFEVRIDRGTYIQIVGGVGIHTQEERTKFYVKQRETLV